MIDRIREKHGLTAAHAEDAAYASSSLHYGVSFRQGFRKGWWAGVAWVLEQQANGIDITEEG